MSLSPWMEVALAPRAPLEGAARCEIAVVGGGVTGAAAALTLARHGARVALLERATLGSGATGRNPGVVGAPCAHSYAIAAKAMGREQARALWAMARHNRELIARSGLDCGYAARGGLELAVDAAEAQVLIESAALLCEDGYAATLTEVPGFAGALFHREYAELNPLQLVRGLANLAEKAGARIYEQSPATLERVDPVVLRTPRGELTAQMALLATNAYTPAVASFFDDVIVAMRAQMLATEPLAERVLDAPATVDHGFEIVRQLPDGRVLACGGRRASVTTEYTLAERPTEPVQSALERFLHERWPRTKGARVSHRWAGVMALTCDELPNVGPVPGTVRLYAAAGFHGRGMSLALAAAEMAVTMMLEGRAPDSASAFSPRRHQL